MTKRGGSATDGFARLPRRVEPRRVPEPVGGEQGLFVVDGTWGTIAPLELGSEIRTVGELELIEHMESGGVAVDCRRPEDYRRGTIPGAVTIPHPRMRDRIGELDPEKKTVFFCNGPQCAATPNAIEALLAAGFPGSSILYYRGGLHDWMTLGLPVERS